MNPYVLPLALAALVWIAIIVLNERIGLLRCDRFPSPAFKWAAYVWLGIFVLVLPLLVTASALHPPTARQLASTPFYLVFLLHAILVLFLAGWWFLSGRPPLSEYLSLHRENRGEKTLAGFAVGIGGWITTLIFALIFAGLLKATGVIDKPPKPPEMVAWMTALPWWKKASVVLAAMTIEEAFFRAWLQKRVGLIASTLLFALAHFTYGQPLFLVGVAIISLIIGFVYYRTKDILPGVIAHGVFDAVQLFVLAPLALRMMGHS